MALVCGTAVVNFFIDPFDRLGCPTAMGGDMGLDYYPMGSNGFAKREGGLE